MRCLMMTGAAEMIGPRKNSSPPILHSLALGIDRYMTNTEFLITANTQGTNPSSTLVDAIFNHYRQAGFPYYNLSTAEKRYELDLLADFPHDDLIQNGTIKQAMQGLSLAWSYHPHSWEVRCGTAMTPMEVFESDTNLRKAIEQRIQHGCRSITDSEIRKGLRSVSGAQGVSNFRPSAAAAIYHAYLPEAGGTVWDMSAGFGGRLLGGVACPRVTRYIGTDPCTRTIAGLRQMASEIGRDGLEVELHEIGSEDFVPEANSLDLCFTSPPYFDTEKYSDEPTQSYIKFAERKNWLHGYLGTTLKNCWYGLKPDGKLFINIANVKTYPTLEQDFVALATSSGWKLESTLQYRMSKMMGTRKARKAEFKDEPVFAFCKA